MKEREDKKKEGTGLVRGETDGELMVLAFLFKVEFIFCVNAGVTVGCYV